jgi:hypothetical protein
MSKRDPNAILPSSETSYGLLKGDIPLKKLRIEQVMPRRYSTGRRDRRQAATTPRQQRC